MKEGNNLKIVWNPPSFPLYSGPDFVVSVLAAFRGEEDRVGRHAKAVKGEGSKRGGLSVSFEASRRF